MQAVKLLFYRAKPEDYRDIPPQVNDERRGVDFEHKNRGIVAARPKPGSTQTGAYGSGLNSRNNRRL